MAGVVASEDREIRVHGFLEIEDINLRFGGFRVLNGVSLAVQKGEMLGLIGPNGAGKTTLLNVIAGALAPDSGRICFEDVDITKMPSDIRCRRGISRTFQIARAFPGMSALDNVRVAAAFGVRSRSSAEAGRAARRTLESVHFPSPPELAAADLNAVQLKRLDLARALASEPRLLLLDEMFTGLTPLEISEIMNLLHGLCRRGVTCIVVEHLMHVIMQECSRVAVLCSGELIADGVPRDVSRHPRVVEAYLGTDQ